MIFKTRVKLLRKDQIKTGDGNCSNAVPGGSIITDWQDEKDLSSSGRFTFIVTDKDDSDYVWNYVKVGDIIPVLLYINCPEDRIYILNFISNVLNQDRIDRTYIKESGEFGLLKKEA